MTMDLFKLTSPGVTEHLSTMFLTEQTILDKFWSWCHQCDVAYVFCILFIMDFQDYNEVISTPLMNLLNQYMAISLTTVLKYQTFVNKWRSNIDVESCNWTWQVLELLMPLPLLVQIKQSCDILPK